MSKEKIDEDILIDNLVKKVKKKCCQESFDKLHLLLSEYISKLKYQFFIPGMSSDDLEQECLIALRYKAILDYDSEQGEFIPFAKLCLKRHIITVVKSAGNNKHIPLNSALSLSFDVDLNDEDDENVFLLGAIPSKNKLPGNYGNKKFDIIDRVSRVEQIIKLANNLINTLTTLEGEVLSLYANKLSYKKAVDKMIKRGVKSADGRTPDTKMIDNSMSRIKSKAKKVYEELLEEESGFIN